MLPSATTPSVPPVPSPGIAASLLKERSSPRHSTLPLSVHSSGCSWRRDCWEIHSYGCICDTSLRWRDGDIFSGVLPFPGQCGDLTGLSLLCSAKTKASFGAIWTGPESSYCLLPTLWPWAKERFFIWVSFIHSTQIYWAPATYYAPIFRVLAVTWQC